MYRKTDTRLGSELGLEGPNAHVPAFQIVNDTSALLQSFISRIMSLKYGKDAEEVRRSPQWPQIDAKKVEFSRRFNALGDDAVKAAALAEEIRLFSATVVDPFATAWGDRGL